MDRQMINLGFIQQRYPEGTHICLIYSDDLEREQIISKFVKSGLDSNERVSYFAMQPTGKELLGMLAQVDVDLSAQGLELLDATQTYCPDGQFIPERMLDTLRNHYTETLAGGRNAARVTGEMHWALQPIPGNERLMEYESQVNLVVQTHPITAICQYDARKFNSETIVECLKVHPYIIIRGQIVENPYYIRPEEYLKNHPAREANC